MAYGFLNFHQVQGHRTREKEYFSALLPEQCRRIEALDEKIPPIERGEKSKAKEAGGVGYQTPMRRACFCSCRRLGSFTFAMFCGKAYRTG